MRSKLILILVFFTFSFSLFGQKRINRETWRELKDGLYYEQEENEEKDKKNKDTEDWTKKLNKDGNNNLKEKQRDSDFLKEKYRESDQEEGPKSSWSIPPWLSYLAFIIVGIILVVVIIMLFFKDRNVKDKKIDIKHEEDLPIEKPFNELDALLAKSISEGDYREAVRLYFIYLIKTLREKGWINWEKKKTNTAYLFEMRDKKEYSAFSQVTLYFEIIWYGNRNISKEQFEQLKPQFDELLKSIRSSNG